MNAIIVSFGLFTDVWEKPFSACHIYDKVLHKKIGKTSYELWKDIKPNLEYLKVWGCLANIMLHEPKIRKLGSRIGYCDFIGFACNNSCYRFLVIKNDVLDYNIIIKSENAIFFENMFPLKNKKKLLHESSLASNKFVDDVQELRRSKRAGKKKEFR
jgi:hypothetical protein